MSNSVRIVKRIAALAAALMTLLVLFPRGRGAETASAEPANGGLTSIECSEADAIIVERAMRLAFLGSPEGTNTWTPRYSFYACNSQKKYQAGVPENSMPYSRSALFNTTDFVGKQQYVGWVDADSGATPDFAYSIANFLRMANEAGSDFDLAARAATAQGANWGALLGSDCSAFLSYAWQIPHMTTYMFTSDAVEWNISRQVPATRGHESAYTYADLKALCPGDAMICCNRSGTDEHGNPIYRGHCIIITDVKLDASGTPKIVETVEEISPRAIFKSRSADEFLTYANKLHSSGAYYKFYRLVSKRHLKLEIEITYDPVGGTMEENSIAFVFAKDADGRRAVYGDALAPQPEREGYTFLGWGLDLTGSDVLSPNTPIDLMRDHTLYARWSRD
ncbi:MAG: InlB B-repeat-containing protein [Clostridia bacterium]|nr:InlB B-repeat-containing protein [Clostridia bacterium]